MERKVRVDSEQVQYGDAVFTFYWVLKREALPVLGPVLHSHTVCELHIVTDEANVYVLEQGTVEVKSGEMIVFAPHVIHSSAENAAHACVVAFSLEKCEGKDGFYAYFHETLQALAQKPIPVSKELAAYANALCTLPYDDSVYTRSKIKYLISGFVSALFDCMDPEGFRQSRTASGGSAENLPLIIEYLLGNSATDLQEIADAIGYSARHTSRLIAKLFRMPLSEIRKYRALRIAERLLAAGQISAEEIAVLSGFENAECLKREIEKHEQRS